MNRLVLFCMLTTLTACGNVSVTTGKSISSDELAQFFAKHTVDGNAVAALKKRSLGGESYLATIHGYPNNLDVCNQLIAPYNEEPDKSAVPGSYYCELLQP